MPTRSKDLILSLATNLDFNDYARFLKSARRYCPAETTDIVLLVEPMEARYIELAEQLQVKLIPIANFSRVIHHSIVLKLAYRIWLLLLQIGTKLKLKGFAQIRRDATAAWIHPICSRHFFGRDFLSVNPNYRCVLLSDSRDVVFQDNPFEFVSSNVLNVFAEDPALALGKKNLETEWFKDVFGAKLLRRVAGKLTVCCGTTMGSPKVILSYLNLMEQEILNHYTDVVDQSVHNKLVYLDLPKDRVKIHSNTAGVVLTLGELPEDAYEILNQQVYVKGQVVPVLHQYDRVPALKSMLEKLYDVTPAHPALSRS
ncbi:MAG: hypothetical protein MUC48_20420 [Leptolyngbya sp. Prado105]|jgi:hypothetical protein|nr:hypothetical protein [Leptolyngbya sp. Prado105]